MATESDFRIGLVVTGEPRQARELEALPIDSLWVGGHIASPNPSPEAMVALAQLAAVTERVTVGTSILLLPLYPPALVAKQIADLDRSSGGRVVLGVGVGGEYPQEFCAVQVPVAERGRRTDEAIPLLRRLWSATEISHTGSYYSMESVKIHPAPLQVGGPPIVVAGRKPPAMQRAALLGDGWFPYLYSPRRYAESVTTIRAIAQSAGRDLQGFQWYVFVFVNINSDGDQARAEAATSMGGNYRQDFQAMVNNVAAAGTASEVTTKLCQFYDAGARHFVFLPACPAEKRQAVVDRLVGDVVPAVRQHSSSSSAFLNLQ